MSSLQVPMIQWDGMDSRNRVVRVGQTGTFPACMSIPFPCGTVGWDLTIGTVVRPRVGRTGMYPILMHKSPLWLGSFKSHWSDVCWQCWTTLVYVAGHIPGNPTIYYYRQSATSSLRDVRISIWTASLQTSSFMLPLIHLTVIIIHTVTVLIVKDFNVLSFAKHKYNYVA